MQKHAVAIEDVVPILPLRMRSTFDGNYREFLQSTRGLTNRPEAPRNVPRSQPSIPSTSDLGGPSTRAPPSPSPSMHIGGPSDVQAAQPPHTHDAPPLPPLAAALFVPPASDLDDPACRGSQSPQVQRALSPPRLSYVAKGKAVARSTTPSTSDRASAYSHPAPTVAEEARVRVDMSPQRLVAFVEVPQMREVRARGRAAPAAFSSPIILSTYANLPVYGTPAMEDGQIVPGYAPTVRLSLFFPVCALLTGKKVAPGYGCTPCTVAGLACNLSKAQQTRCYQCVRAKVNCNIEPRMYCYKLCSCFYAHACGNVLQMAP